MKVLVFILFTLFALNTFAQTAITPVTPTETANESATVTSDGTNGNSVQNPAGDVILVIFNNTSSSSGVATVNVQNSNVSIPGAGSVTKSSQTCDLAAGENCVIGPFPPLFWNDGNSNLQLTYTGGAASDLTVMAIKP